MNWFHPVSGLNLAEHSYSRQIINKLDFLTVSADFVLESEHSDIDELAALPALSIPVATKSEFEMPKTHIAALTSVIPSITHMVVIGWRANEAHFRALLEQLDRARLKSMVVTRSADSAAKVAAVLGLPTVSPVASGHNFSSLIGSKELHAFLAS